MKKGTSAVLAMIILVCSMAIFIFAVYFFNFLKYGIFVENSENTSWQCVKWENTTTQEYECRYRFNATIYHFGGWNCTENDECQRTVIKEFRQINDRSCESNDYDIPANSYIYYKNLTTTKTICTFEGQNCMLIEDIPRNFQGGGLQIGDYFCQGGVREVKK